VTEGSIMTWAKSPQSLIDLFAESLPDDPRIATRKMFGYPAAFANGNMFAGLFGDGMFVRLAPSAREAARPPALRTDGGPPEQDLHARPGAVLADEAAVADLIAGALTFAAALPAKVKKGNG